MNACFKFVPFKSCWDISVWQQSGRLTGWHSLEFCWNKQNTWQQYWNPACFSHTRYWALRWNYQSACCILAQEPFNQKPKRESQQLGLLLGNTSMPSSLHQGQNNWQAVKIFTQAPGKQAVQLQCACINTIPLLNENGSNAEMSPAGVSVGV